MIIKTDQSNIDDPISNDLPEDNILLAIGKLVAISSQFEEKIAMLMSMLFGCEPEVIANVAYSQDMYNRCQSLRGVMAYRLGSRNKSDEGINLKNDKDMIALNKLFKKVINAVEIRNDVVHSTWHISKTPNCAVQMNPRGRQITGYPGGDIFLVSIEDIDENAKFIALTAEELWKFFWLKFGNWFLERAKQNEDGIYMVK